ncbi:hypothetical protein NP493_403g01020 [Ridgeia piscesae]|uniref:TROVE domain-containing protein n=1 Tax=Ridgeia piscesae TaxID=27915 RepID=A0AAD9NUM9_RIDPI|nr:hypothetical protein NP493_403g01020 [Ridgeia piscesae]
MAVGVSDVERLARLLCLGCDSATYQVGDNQLTPQNATCVTRMLQSSNGQEVVNMVIEYSVQGVTAKQEALVFAVAMCARQRVDPATRTYCYDNLCEICRTPTQLFLFINYCLTPGWSDEYPQIRWGRAFREAISRWYLRFMEVPNGARLLAEHVTKYGRRHGWRHQGVLRMAHPKAGPSDGCGVAAVLKYIAKGLNEAEQDLQATDANVLQYLQAVEAVKAQNNPETLDTGDLAERIRQHKLVREHVSTRLLHLPPIWEALLEHMPMTAMIRNLGKMSAIGILDPGSQNEVTIITRLGDIHRLEDARIHPFNVLLARLTYQRGRGDEGSIRWVPNEAISNALDSAFYETFTFMHPTRNKRFLLALDESAAMFQGSVNGCRSVHAATAAAAMVLVTARTEEHCEIVSFSRDVRPSDIQPEMTLPQAENAMRRVPGGETDCTQPIQYALQRYESPQHRQFDVIVIYTANIPDRPQLSPAAVMQDYRRQAKLPDAKLVVCAMKSNGFTIADPDVPNMLNVVGFDAYAPEVIRRFVNGELM